jgi:di/tricarboxylate transporter
MIVLLGILRKEQPDPTGSGETILVDISHEEAAKMIFSHMFGSVIMLLLGGFSIAAALSKYHITKSMATTMLARAGTNSIFILLMIMFVATFASMWISNVAAPVLCFSVMQVKRIYILNYTWLYAFSMPNSISICDTELMY